MSLRQRAHTLFSTMLTMTAREFAAQSTTLKDEIEALFALVEPKPDWKAPIRAYVSVVEHPTLDWDDLMYAIEFFTASQATVERQDDTTFLVTAAGYAAGPAGDH